MLKRLGPEDLEWMERLLTLFGEVFGEPGTYGGNRPDAAYLRDLLGRESFIALVAMEDDEAVGGLVAYELRKFEQPRSELYIYDLAVADSHRRRGIATALIEETKRIAREAGAYVVSVQADYGDDAAIALYSKLGTREEVLHFDLKVG